MTRPLDHFDEPEPLRLGCPKCDHCHAIGPVYSIFAQCRECSETICDACLVPETLVDDEGLTATCFKCHEDAVEQMHDAERRDQHLWEKAQGYDV